MTELDTSEPGTSGSADGATRLGRDVARRFRRQTSQGRMVGRSVGMVAASSAQFVALAGRSLATRRMLGGSVPVPAWRTGGLPVRPPADYLMAASLEDRAQPQRSASWEERQFGAAMVARQRSAIRAGSSAVVPPRGLPQATARRRFSPAGRDTGPAAASNRMVAEPAFVRNPPEVRAAGAMVSPREAARTVPAASTRPSPLTPASPRPAAPWPTAPPVNRSTPSNADSGAREAPPIEPSASPNTRRSGSPASGPAGEGAPSTRRSTPGRKGSSGAAIPSRDPLTHVSQTAGPAPATVVLRRTLSTAMPRAGGIALALPALDNRMAPGRRHAGLAAGRSGDWRPLGSRAATTASLWSAPAGSTAAASLPVGPFAPGLRTAAGTATGTAAAAAAGSEPVRRSLQDHRPNRGQPAAVAMPERHEPSGRFGRIVRRSRSSPGASNEPAFGGLP
ncbi:MAG: hypothetical protein QOG64_307, partial [Acidimicrobiaceae bacterium]|nr:hypothetical protein [Acidimicrobiaceae bacterium]